MQEATIRVEGMTCNGCVASVTRVLKALPGVGSVDVSLEQREARVQFDPSRTDLDNLKKTIEAAGYHAP
jgi:copper chaperone